MRNVGSIMVLVAVAAAGCESPQRALLLGPTPLASTPPPVPPPPLPVAHPRLGDAVAIAIGETLRSQTTADDPLCAPEQPHRCRYFKVTAPSGGSLRVTMRWSAAQPDPYPLDIGVYGPTGEWFAVVGPGAQRYVEVLADAGATYLIEIWSFLTPAEPFELTSSLVSR